MKKISYRKIIFLPSAILLLLVPLLFLQWFDAKILQSIFLGAALCFVNYAVGVSLIKYSIDKREKTFQIMVFGGMVVRLFFSLILIFLFLNFLKLNQNYFIFTIFICYTYYLIVEIYYLHITDVNPKTE